MSRFLVALSFSFLLSRFTTAVPNIVLLFADDQSKELFLTPVDTGSAAASPNHPVEIQSRRGNDKLHHI